MSSASDRAAASTSSSANPFEDGTNAGEDQDEILAYQSERDPYSLLSELIADETLHSMTIFRRFDQLAIRNLLYLESELAQLEHEVDELDQEVNIEDYYMAVALRSWPIDQSLVDQTDDPAIREHIEKRRALVQKIRETLKEYHEALKRTEQVFNLKRPRDGDIRSMRKILSFQVAPDTKPQPAILEPQTSVPNAIETRARNPDASLKALITSVRKWQGTRSPPVRSQGQQASSEDLEMAAMRTSEPQTQGARPSSDVPLMFSGFLRERLVDDCGLCVLAPKTDGDLLPRVFEPLCSPYLFTSSGKTAIWLYERMLMGIQLFYTAIAVSILVGTIVGLNFCKSNAGRLILFSVSTLVFACFCALVTNAERHDIYSVVAAFAAVLVVFIGTALGGPDSSSASSSTNSNTSPAPPLNVTKNTVAQHVYARDDVVHERHGHFVQWPGGAYALLSVLLLGTLVLFIARTTTLKLMRGA